MLDSAFDRTLTYRLSSAYDCWGNRRSLRRGTQNGIWFIDASRIDEPVVDAPPAEDGAARVRRLAEFQSSGRFTAIELATLHALIVDRLSIGEIAEQHGCSCAGRLKLVAQIQEGAVIRRILRHLGLPDVVPEMRPSRAPPLPFDLFDDRVSGDDD